MKYIQKLKPDFFDSDVADLKQTLIKSSIEDKKKIWNKYKEKRKLKEYILENEQNYLCGYCEAQVDLDNSHIEHIEPKINNLDLLTFEYSNLLVSCNGTCFSDEKISNTCGHKKGKNFNKKLFLDPTKHKNIREQFKYLENGEIEPNGKKNKEAKYTLELLELNCPKSKLKEARIKANSSFRTSVKEHSKKTGKPIKEIVLNQLKKENLPFISFLIYRNSIAS